MTASIANADSISADAPIAANAPAQHVRGERIVALQVLRAVAAIGVVMCHFEIFLSRANGGSTGLLNLQSGGAGVDLFFVISGFVIVYASEPLFGKAGGAVTFITYRLVRIVPLYWLVTTLYLIIGFARPELGKIYPLGYVVASYVFFPLARPNGDMVPIVSQGWSLNFEILFYFIFAAAVILQRRAAVLMATLVIAALVVAGTALDPVRQPFAFWTAPVMIEFVFGMILGAAYREGMRLPKWLALAVIAAGIALFAAAFGPGRIWQYGLPLIVMGATMGDFSMRSRPWSFIGLIGDASYSLYLIHLLPILATLFLAQKVGIPLTAAPWLLLVLCLAAAIALAIGVHLGFERPVTRRLRWLTSPIRFNSLSANRLVRP